MNKPHNLGLQDANTREQSNETRGGLTPEQLKNWRIAFPELRLVSDQDVQRFRDNIQNKFK